MPTATTGTVTGTATGSPPNITLGAGALTQEGSEAPNPAEGNLTGGAEAAYENAERLAVEREQFLAGENVTTNLTLAPGQIPNIRALPLLLNQAAGNRPEQKITLADQCAAVPKGIQPKPGLGVPMALRKQLGGR